MPPSDRQRDNVPIGRKSVQGCHTESNRPQSVRPSQEKQRAFEGPECQLHGIDGLLSVTVFDRGSEFRMDCVNIKFI